MLACALGKTSLILRVPAALQSASQKLNLGARASVHFGPREGPPEGTLSVSLQTLYRELRSS